MFGISVVVVSKASLCVVTIGAYGVVGDKASLEVVDCVVEMCLFAAETVVGSKVGLINFTVTIVGGLVLNRDSFGVVVCAACVVDCFVLTR